MKLVTFLQAQTERVGALTADETAVLPLPYADMLELIEKADQLQDAAAAAEAAAEPIPLSEVTLLAPIPRPGHDVICLGVNYKDHAKEAKRYDSEVKDEYPAPVYFSKRVVEAVAPGGFIESHPGLVERLDYEAELAVIIGKTARGVKAENAADYIFGYTVLNDVSARRLQNLHTQWFFGKSLDGFTPMGPCITTADEIAFPPALGITCKVNGELRQNAVTDQLIHSIASIIEGLSAGITLVPGTIIATGTPAGVGNACVPPKLLKAGDVVECAIEGIGTLTNTVR